MTANENQPLLSPSLSRNDSIISHINTEDGKPHQPSRSIEDDVLPETSTLGRTLTWSSAYILVISRVIGSGIFATPGVIVKAVGSVGLSLTLWIFGAVIAACGLAVALEYGCMLPRSGGDKVYLEFTYRRPRYLATSNCIVFAQYTMYAFEIEATDVLRKGLAVGLLTAVTVVHGCFRKTGIAIQNVLGWIKVALVVFMVFSGLFVVIFRPEGLDGRRSHFPTGTDVWKDTEWSWGTISTSLFKVFYSYAGLNNVSNVLNEVRNPVRTLKSVSITALITACVLYSLVNVAYFIVIPLDEIKESKELIAALFFEKVFGHTIGKVVLPLAVALSGVGNVMVVTFALARLNQEIARQGFLPYPELLASSKPFNAPLGGLIVHYIPSLLVITLPPSSEVYSFILEVEGYPGQIFALATSAGLLWLRYHRPDLKRPFKAWTLAVVLRIALCLALLAAPFFPPEHKKDNGIWYATYAVVGISVVVFGFLYCVEKDFLDDDQIKDQYYKETEQLLKDATGATRIHIFDHTIRRQPPGDGSISRQLRGPVQRVHIDQSYDAALSRVPFHLHDEADKLLQSRVQIINVWRPIKTVQRDPLAVAEANSVSDDSLVVTELIYPTRRGETYAVNYDPAHRWYYKSKLSPEEVILIKCFDSKKDGRARRVPHTAFHIPGTEDKEGRESIEDRNTNTTSMALTGQIYVEKLSPSPELREKLLPIIFIAGAAQSGTNFLETPDGRPGWASYFVAKGHTVYLSDQPSRGRSFWHPGQGTLGTIGSPETVSNIFTDVAHNGNQWPQAKLHTQWPGTGRMGDATFDAFYRSQLQLQTDRFISEEENAQAYSALVDLVGECYIIAHSQAGAYGWRVGDMRPDLIKGLIQLEPSGPPFTLRPPFGNDPAFAFGLTDLAIAYEPSAGNNAENIETYIEPAIDADHNECILQTSPAKQLVNLAKIPQLVVTGEASFHAPYDHCTVKYLEQVGVEVDYADLGKEGIHGNGHMFFMEKNNMEIADRVYTWIARN
ncbi:hypothetical protein E8E13_001526 [Curvularia kusanoi]|uniref:Uncharacterized protein n=1 Tax=Curvularia kusanoi TaxID=90978 RepID=A0A9P4T3Y9_CURKU|nr:hypothetical protein E8E13_001526 [Curvularia kusanoi]